MLEPVECWGLFPVFNALFLVFTVLFLVFNALFPVFTFYSVTVSTAAYTFVCMHHPRLYTSSSYACIISFLASCPNQPR